MIEQLLKKIKAKKPLEKLDDNYVRPFILEYFRKNPKIKKKLDAYSEKDVEKSLFFEKIVKAIRNELNKSYGVFWLKEGSSFEAHSSTYERKEIYSELYHQIFSITGVPSRILDLSAGLNPLSYPYMKPFKGTYFATELTKKDCETLEKIFKKEHIVGSVLQIDLLNFEKLPSTDLCFLFKILDVIDFKGHKRSEELLKKIPASWLIVSFSTTTLSQRTMNQPKRKWFEQLLKRLDWHYQVLTFPNEIFYVIQKSH